MAASYHYPLLSRTDWQTLRAKYKVPQGAVSGVNLGASFEAAYSTFALKTMSKHLTAIRKLIKDIETYAAKVPDAKLKDDMKTQLLPRARTHEAQVADVVKQIANWDPYAKDLLKALADPKLKTMKPSKAGIPLLAEKMRVCAVTFAQYNPGWEKYGKPLEYIRDYTSNTEELITQATAIKYSAEVKNVYTSVKAKIG